MQSVSLQDATRSAPCLRERSHALQARSLNWRLILALLANVAMWSLLLHSFVPLIR